MSTPQKRTPFDATREISVIFDMPERLAELESYLRGDLESNWLFDATDEQMFAAVYGWHIRGIQIPGLQRGMLPLINTEVERRRSSANPLGDPNDVARFAQSRKRGARMEAGHLLLPGEVSDYTVFALWTRILRTHEFLTEFITLDPLKSIRALMAAPDQLLIDTFIWVAVHTPDGDGYLHELGDEPASALWALRETAEHVRKANLTFFDENGDEIDEDDESYDDLYSEHPGEWQAYFAVRALMTGYIPPLNSETEMYRRRNHIAVDDAFWTDDRIRSFIDLASFCAEAVEPGVAEPGAAEPAAPETGEAAPNTTEPEEG